MISSVWVSLGFVAACAFTYAHIENDKEINQGVPDYIAEERTKRGAAGLARLLIRKGLEAVNYLRKGAQEHRPQRYDRMHNNARIFTKQGSYRQAVRDFDAVNPLDKRDFTTPTGSYGKAGTVGDRLIYVKSSNEVSGKPSVEIYQIGGLKHGDRSELRLTDIITYLE